ncbi:MAG: AbrB/MazE/SpoVT family DNA-binding domain-containing protein [Armatimonadota bacterium]|nr:AbrB/MazE/SpoVT family DNA-binding domain-containing protein [Armatimonadota bacterium]
MTQVTVSSKYQVVIPLEIRKRLNVRKGQKMLVVVRNNIIELVPDRDISELRGFLKGMPAGNIREEEDRF